MRDSRRGKAVKSERLPRREREKLRQRQEMLAVALDLFAEKGYHNVSMHEVAEKSEFAVGTLYKFFQNKEDLYKALVLEQCGRFEDEIVQALEKQGDAIQRLRNYIRSKTELFRSNLPFIRLFLAESRGASFNIQAGLDEELRKRHDGILEKLSAIFESGIDNRQFREIASPYHLAVALDSVVDSFSLLWLAAPDRHPFPADPDTLLEIFLKGLIEP